MSKARSIVEYFTKSTQAMDKLLNFQRTTTMVQYATADRALKVIQDINTRWWSTFRMLRRLLFLKPAIMALEASGQVSCVTLESYQWEILEQILKCLEPLAGVQRILEGQDYPTGSLAPFCMDKVRQSYKDMINDTETHPAVVSLALTLLEDFETRYKFESGKLKYPGSLVITAFMNRYTHLHQFLFMAALLDPRMKGNLKKIMASDDYDELIDDVVDVMTMKHAELIVGEEEVRLRVISFIILFTYSF